MPATMRDVAALAGVSLKTVSRVVNLEPHTRPEVVARVRSAIAELEWVPNGSARSLRTGRTGVIAVAVPELRRPYVSGLAEAVVSEVYRRGLQAAVEPVQGLPERTRAILASLGRAVDGVVLIGQQDATQLDGLRAQDPVVTLHAGEATGVDSVDPDLVESATLLARHLVVMGRQRPVMLGFDRFPDGERVVARALRLAGLTPSTAGVAGLRYRAQAALATPRLLEAFPDADAVLCGSDELALGVLAVLAQRGIAVPDDIAVAGFDNLDDSTFSTPSLTTIDPGTHRLARSTLDLLADRLSGLGDPTPRRVISPVDLVRRESTLGASLS
ncbi:LacI family transcriptional regulator [Serinibacter arcticus]|uniref:LacI family transcriptional regulator n=1 Tax=Serinibacter arcticus TaxID=1655435 RepID=A0A2U1ZXW0_9MICO|nr:LacI family DNA-binding transcriptional regulator [Serinibacter arcticus]PWD51811.1 LacI family transcriptional regulator [Serinibacter arcticus]